MKTKKNIWVTGASSGIGHRLAQELINQGDFVLISGRRQEELKKLQACAPNRVAILDFDLSDPEFVSGVKSRLGELTDVLDQVILAAGVCEYVDVPDCPDHLYRRVMEVNFFAQVSCLSIALPLLRKSEQRAHIVGIGSLAAHLPFPRAEAYGASKSAFEYWLHSLRIDLAAEKMDITVVSPGFIDTPLTRKNDFVMPALMSLDQACPIILKGINSRKRQVSFPRRLNWGLKLLSALDVAWYQVIAPRMSRSQRL